MASLLLISRYFVTTRITTFPIFQLATASFYILITCFGIHQVFSESTSSFPIFLLCYPMAMALNLVATVILGMQTFDMGLISDNCGDVEVCYPFVKPIALAGWILVSASTTFLIVNSFMLSTYWQLRERLVDEEQVGYSHQEYMHTHANHHYSHQHYPSNFSKSGSSNPISEDIELAMPSKIRTPQPKRNTKDLFNDPNEIIVITKSEASKLAIFQHGPPSATTSQVSNASDYKSLQISPIDFSAHNRFVS